MTDTGGKKATNPALSGDEQVTLRRIAFGESPARTLRAADLDQLRTLRLIEEGKDGPMLTPKGRRLYETLPRALGAPSAPHQAKPLESLSKALREAKR